MTNANKTGRLLNITHVSDAVLDAVLAIAASDAAFDFDALTRRELIEVEALSGVSLTAWIRAAPAEFATRNKGADFEAMILDRQVDGYFGPADR
jgi:hypothetical protein